MVLILGLHTSVLIDGFHGLIYSDHAYHLLTWIDCFVASKTSCLFPLDLLLRYVESVLSFFFMQNIFLSFFEISLQCNLLCAAPSSNFKAYSFPIYNIQKFDLLLQIPQVYGCLTDFAKVSETNKDLYNRNYSHNPLYLSSTRVRTRKNW